MTRQIPTRRTRPRVARRPRALAANTAIIIAVSAAALAACAKVGEDVFNHETAPFDEPIRAWTLAQQTRGVRTFFLVVTRAGAPAVIIPLTAAFADWLRRKRGLPIAGAMVLAPAVALTLFLAIKAAYRRARPTGAKRLRDRTYSFPSGHATTSAAVFGTIAYVLWRERFIRPARAWPLGIVPPVVIGASRVYLDTHWSTDVLGGWSLGSLVTALSAFVYEKLRRDTRRRGVRIV